MFRLDENAEKFNRFFAITQQQGQKPKRVKPHGAQPKYAWELTKINTANANGIPLHNNGRTTATPRYKVTLYCDVCVLPLATVDARGNPKEVEIREVGEITEAFRSEKPLLEKQHFAAYSGQCSSCGRWGAKGQNHVYCFDAEQKTCTQCIE